LDDIRFENTILEIPNMAQSNGVIIVPSPSRYFDPKAIAAIIKVAPKNHAAPITKFILNALFTDNFMKPPFHITPA